MTVTFIFDVATHEPYVVDNQLVASSDYVTGMLRDLDVNNINIPVYSMYTDTFVIYIDFVAFLQYLRQEYIRSVIVYELPTYESNMSISTLIRSLQFVHPDIVTTIRIKDAEVLSRCFDMESWLIDEIFFEYLMLEAYKIWEEFQPYIRRVPDIRLFYLYVPFPLVPHNYTDRVSFRKEWATINKDRKVSLLFHDKTEHYSYKISFHINGKLDNLIVTKIVTGIAVYTYTYSWDSFDDSQTKNLASYECIQQGISHNESSTLRLRVLEKAARMRVA